MMRKNWMRVYKVMLPWVGRDSAISYPLSYFMLHVLGSGHLRNYNFFNSDSLYVIVTKFFISQTKHPLLRIMSELLC